jgi:hypothetical protein
MSTQGNSNGTTTTTTTPPGIPYQAEVRSDNGEVLANANVNVRFTLHELTANGTVSYQETHALTTNELGLFAATIGSGTATQSTFAGINWSQTTKFLQVEVDAGNGYITMGNQQLMSVPYALYAANSQPGPQGPVGQTGPQGLAGLDGAAGSDGFNSLVRTSQISNTNECGTNGILIEAGIDFNRNDFLDNSEVQPNSAQVICSTNSNQSSIISFSGTYPTLNSPILGQMAISSTSGATFIFNGLVWNQILTSCTQPTAANAGSNQQVLNYQQVQLNANSPAIGSGRWKIINGSGGSFDNPINPAAKFVGLPNTNYTLGWVTTSLCDSSISTINIQYISSTTITQSGIWTVPEGIDSIKIELIGAGGGGAPGATCGYYGCYVKTGGGGAGGYGVIYLPVEANQQLSFTVGTGGSASANGTSSIFENYYAGGGNSGAIGGSGGISNCPVSSQGNNGGLTASGCCCPSNYFNGAAGVNNRGGGGDGGFYANCGSSIAFSQTGQNGGIIITPLN